MRRILALAALTTGAALAFSTPALADGGGPAKVDLEKAVKKGSEISTKVGKAEKAGHEYQVSSAKSGNAVVSVAVYLYATDTGTPLKSLTGTVICNPCNYTVGGTNPALVKLNLDDMFDEKGGFPKATPDATALVVVSSDNAEDVNFQHINTPGGPLNLKTHFISSGDFDKVKL